MNFNQSPSSPVTAQGSPPPSVQELPDTERETATPVGTVAGPIRNPLDPNYRILDGRIVKASTDVSTAKKAAKRAEARAASARKRKSQNEGDGGKATSKKIKEEPMDDETDLIDNQNINGNEDIHGDLDVQPLAKVPRKRRGKPDNASFVAAAVILLGLHTIEKPQYTDDTEEEDDDEDVDTMSFDIFASPSEEEVTLPKEDPAFAMTLSMNEEGNVWTSIDEERRPPQPFMFDDCVNEENSDAKVQNINPEVNSSEAEKSAYSGDGGKISVDDGCHPQHDDVCKDELNKNSDSPKETPDKD